MCAVEITYTQTQTQLNSQVLFQLVRYFNKSKLKSLSVFRSHGSRWFFSFFSSLATVSRGRVVGLRSAHILANPTHKASRQVNDGLLNQKPFDNQKVFTKIYKFYCVIKTCSEYTVSL